MRDVNINGQQFTVADEPGDFWNWVEQGRYNSEWNRLSEFLKPEHTFVDLGAWVGSHSLYASRVASRVISVEPDPVAFDILEVNLKANGLPVPHRLAITGKQGTITLGSGFLGASTTRANPREGGGIGAWEPGHQFDIPCTTLREFISRERLTGPLFLKIDVEGSEEDIIRDLDFFREYRLTVYLSLHPFWWRDQVATYRNLETLSSLYPRIVRDRQELILANG